MGQLLTANAVTEMPDLKVALFVGDILTKRDVIRLQNLAPKVTVVNMYGTTETQRAVSYLAIPNDHLMAQRKEIIPAGKGMKDVQLLILTPGKKKFFFLKKKKGMEMNFFKKKLFRLESRLTGIGEMGEIYTRSPHMAAGYLGLEEATKLKFLQNPFRPQDLTDRFYRTGDLGRYMPSGIGTFFFLDIDLNPYPILISPKKKKVECVGRADDQVKIRGFRIELGEIDTFLSQVLFL